MPDPAPAPASEPTPDPVPAPGAAHATAEVITRTWRDESARLVGALTRLTRDLDLAEDLAQDALLEALDQWPTRGVPASPAAWLMTTAKRRAIDHFRRAATGRRKSEEWAHAHLGPEGGEPMEVPDFDALVDPIDDDVLRLVFLTCHEALTPDSRAALTLRLVGGLSTAEIARGFFTTEATMGQRISRAKRTVAEVGIDLDVPTGADRVRRLDDVRAVLSLIFTEGHTATSGSDWMRPALALEAIRLALMLADLDPDEPETLGLLALMLLQAARMPARLDAAGAPVLLEDQDRGRWDQDLLAQGLATLAGAHVLAARGVPVGRYFLQACIAAEHARADSAQATDWRRIATLYDTLAAAAPGPVVEVNRAVAHGRAFGPEAGLVVLDALTDDALGGSALLPSVRGDLLEGAGRGEEAAAEFTLAASRTDNTAERDLLLRRAAAARE